jgi:hypothetical protein
VGSTYGKVFSKKGCTGAQETRSQADEPRGAEETGRSHESTLGSKEKGWRTGSIETALRESAPILEQPLIDQRAA